MKDFGKVDLRFMGVNKRLDTLEKELKETRTELSEKIDKIGDRVTVLEKDVGDLKAV